MVSGKEPSSRPLSFWTENDILQYIQTYDVSYCSIYGNIVPVGGGLLRQEPNEQDVCFVVLDAIGKRNRTDFRR